MLKKCIGDPSLILPTESIRIKDNLSYEEVPVQILDHQVRRLRTKDVASVKFSSLHTRTFHVLMPVGLHRLMMQIQTQVPRISIRHAVYPVEHFKVSGEPPCFRRTQLFCSLKFCFIRVLRGQGFAWGQQWSPGAGPAQGVGLGRDKKYDPRNPMFGYMVLMES
ncbi:hypothetical protein MTR67_016735 [Solanum verrucosum]|uniref:Uncharacterized protein n=1 Tax=Solanum verrucosum TaxID=315347 RepID=A0AAF0TRL5_SOLVR|nr:hypothetical protein MTR67_016735 [Solanum verrucosum]